MNIEAIVIQALNASLPVPVSADVPKDRPEAFVTVEKVGGGKSGPGIESVELAVQSWEKRRLAASELSGLVDEAMLSLPGAGSVISKVTREGPYNFPDPDGKHARYQGAYNIIFHNSY
jgi:hypothetical protein